MRASDSEEDAGRAAEGRAAEGRAAEGRAAESRVAESRVAAGRGWLFAAAILTIGLLLRGWLAASLTLQKDEAAYWAWSRVLDPTYALIPFAALRVSCAIFGDHEWAVRLPFLLATTGAGAFFFAFARALGCSGPSSIAALLLFSGNAWFLFVGSHAHPDAFLALFWTGALVAFARADGNGGPQRGEWIHAGAVLAALAALSKYTGFLLWPAWLAVSLWPGKRRVPARVLASATALWLLALSPALLAIVAERGVTVAMAFQLSNVGDRLSLPARIAILPLAPLLALCAPGYLVYVLGLATALARTRAPGARWGWLGAVSAAPAVIAGLRGSIKGNWMLPAFWGTLPQGTARLAETRGGARALRILIGTGLLFTLAVWALLLRPDAAARIRDRVPLARWLDSTYGGAASRVELRHSVSRTWLDRAYEAHGARAVVDSIAARALAFRDAATVSDLYEVVYQARFYRGREALLVRDGRFRRSREFLSEGGRLPDRAIFVTSPGARLPEALFQGYGFLEREPRLSVPIGRRGVRAYDVWRCARREE